MESTVPVYVPDGAKVRVRVELENGDVRELTQTEDWTVPREVDGVKRGRASFILGADLPLGWHRIMAEVSPGSTDQPVPQGAHAAPPADDEADSITVTSALAVTPNHLDLPESLGGRGWGVMAQLYSTRSRGRGGPVTPTISPSSPPSWGTKGPTSCSSTRCTRPSRWRR